MGSLLLMHHPRFICKSSGVLNKTEKPPNLLWGNDLCLILWPEFDGSPLVPRVYVEYANLA
jgi:hypothetical protein